MQCVMRVVDAQRRQIDRVSAAEGSTMVAVVKLDPVQIDEAVGAECARLHVLLGDTGQCMPVNDSWIAATALALGVPVTTQHDDFPELENLNVTRV